MKTIIKGYKKIISPILGQRCKYYPSCSQYALNAISKKGYFLGLFLAVWRILRCNPFSNGGIDEI